MSEKKYGLVGLIGRWKPLHVGGYRVLRSACENSEFVKIGVGSSNKYNLRNPFTSEESKKMIEYSLSPEFDNFEVVEIPDFGHVPEYRDGKRWTQEIVDKFGDLDVFISSNDYVRDLLKDKYDLVHCWELLNKKDQIRLRATHVRIEMAKFGNWERLVPEKVADYIKENNLDDRFRKEFGLKTLALHYSSIPIDSEHLEHEKMHVTGGLK